MRPKDLQTTGKFQFVLLLFILFAYRFFVLVNFGYVFTDSDQVIMWLATMDYSHGVFHEPAFYGQAYNTMFEALLAVPLYKLGVPLHIALPTITTLLALFPFIFLAFIVYRKSSKPLGVLVLSIPLFLPVEYDMITSVSRGFVTGIAISSIGLVALFNPYAKRSFFLFALFSILGFTVNSNAVLLSLPIAAYIFALNFKNVKFYLYSLFGIFLGGFPLLLIKLFYLNNENFIIHSYDLKISINYLLKGLSNLDSFLNPLTPIFWNKGYLIIVLFIIFMIYFFRRKNWAELFSVSCFVLALIFTFSVSKVHDSTNSIFFHGARMYLAIPIVVGLWICFIRVNFRLHGVLILVLSILFASYKVYCFQNILHKNLNRDHVVSIIKVHKLFEVCQELNSFAKENYIDLIVIKNHHHYDFYNYACALCTEDFPPTIRPSYERRTWRMIEEQNEVRNTILIIDSEDNLASKFSIIKNVDEFPAFYLIENNNKKTIKLLSEFDFKIRDF